MLRQYRGKSLNDKTMVISPIVKIPNKDDVLAVLAADCEGKKKLIFEISEDEMKLNDKKIDITEIVNINQRDASVFLLNNFSMPDSTLDEKKYIQEKILKFLRNISLSDIETFVDYLQRILSCFSGDIRMKIFNTFLLLLKVITDCIELALDEIFDDQSKYFRLVDVVICFFGKKSEKLMDQWKTWLSTRKPDHYLSFFEKIDEDDCDGLQFFERTVTMSYPESNLDAEAEKELLQYFHNWLAKQVYDNQERLEREWSIKEKATVGPTEKVCCTVCGGYFYRLSKKS